ncbi:MAG: hypothetical protein WKG07_19165 [Hymenobacter sp.]
MYGAFTFSAPTPQLPPRRWACAALLPPACNNHTAVNTPALVPSFERTNVNTSIFSSASVPLSGCGAADFELTFTYTPSTTTRLPAIRPLVVSSSITATSATISFTAPATAHGPDELHSHCERGARYGNGFAVHAHWPYPFHRLYGEHRGQLRGQHFASQ